MEHTILEYKSKYKQYKIQNIQKYKKCKTNKHTNKTIIQTQKRNTPNKAKIQNTKNKKYEKQINMLAAPAIQKQKQKQNVKYTNARTHTRYTSKQNTYTKQKYKNQKCKQFK